MNGNLPAAPTALSLSNPGPLLLAAWTKEERPPSLLSLVSPLSTEVDAERMLPLKHPLRTEGLHPQLQNGALIPHTQSFPSNYSGSKVGA